MTIEVEAKFKIASDEVETILSQLNDMSTLGSYSLSDPTLHEINDVYYDNDALDLYMQGVSLRLRTRDDVLLLSLKTEQQPKIGSTLTRLEIEGPPVVELLAHVWDTLDTAGLVRQTFRTQRTPPGSITEMLESWGFNQVFTLDNQRTERKVFNADGELMGILMLDRATAHTDHKQSDLTEIEIEGTGEQSQYFPELSDLLQQAFTGKLTPSNESKYRQGVQQLELG